MLRIRYQIKSGKHLQQLLLALVLTCLYSLVIASTSIFAEPYVDDDLQFWGITSMNVKVNDKLTGHLQTETRIHNNIRDMEQSLIIPGATYRVHKNVTVGGYYMFFQDFRPRYRMENRLMQEVTLHKTFPKLKNTTLAYRARIEERMIENTSGVSLRLRHRTRAQMPIKDTSWYLVAQNEFFHNMNGLRKGPKNGFDQNRTFAGVGKHINKKVSVEGGYQMLYSNNPGPAIDQIGHQIFVFLNWNLN